MLFIFRNLSLVELPYDVEELRWEIWPDGIDTDEIKVGDSADEIDKFRCGLLLQGSGLLFKSKEM